MGLSKRAVGDKFEAHAATYLVNKGYSIIAQNFCCKGGELDIVAKRYNQLLIVEVRARFNNKYGLASESVQLKKQQHILHATQVFICQNAQYKDCAIAFAVIAFEAGKLNYYEADFLR